MLRTGPLSKGLAQIWDASYPRLCPALDCSGLVRLLRLAQEYIATSSISLSHCSVVYPVYLGSRAEIDFGEISFALRVNR